MKLAFIGLGIMGSRMAANLLKAGHQVYVYNRTKEKARDLLDQGADWAESPHAAAEQAEVVLTMLANPEAVSETSDDFLSSDLSGKLWMDCSTVNPAFSRSMHQKAEEAGWRFLDAPVAGSRQPAENAELLFLVGGDEEDVQQVTELFEAMGRKYLHLGKHGHGTSMKMVVNLMLGQSMLAFAEAVNFGKSIGLEEQALLDTLLGAAMTAPFLQNIRDKFEKEDYSPNFPLKHMRKDLHLVNLTAYESEVSMPSAAVAKEVFTRAMAEGLGDEDFSAVYKMLDNPRP